MQGKELGKVKENNGIFFNGSNKFWIFYRDMKRI